MESGIYIAGRGIGNPLNLPITHQFVVLVPNAKNLLATHRVSIGASSVIVLGAYNVSGYLRAEANAPSDVSALRTKRELGKVQYGMCFVSEDQPIQTVWNSFEAYRRWRNKPGELEYPKEISDQFDETQFNSNSWAQSIIFWALTMYGSKAKNNFSGFDLGRKRLIPRKYFS